MSGGRPIKPQAPQKLCVLLPGFGYGPDKPLLYYAQRIAAGKGTPVVGVRYTALCMGEATPQACALKSLPGALADAETQIPAGCGEYVLIAKSFGTMVAAAWAKKHPERKLTLLQLTPIADVYDTLYAGMPAWMVTGTADHFSSVPFRAALAVDPAIEPVFVEGGNHSLDTPPDFAAGLDALKMIVKKYNEVL